MGMFVVASFTVTIGQPLKSTTSVAGSKSPLSRPPPSGARPRQVQRVDGRIAQHDLRQGLLSFGHAAFLGVGSYLCGIAIVSGGFGFTGIRLNCDAMGSGRLRRKVAPI